MAEAITSTAIKRYAVVKGANKGIGFEICKQLASNGVMVVLTARDEKRATEAPEKLRGSGLADLVIFHLVDVVDPTSIYSLADFVKTHFGRLDILVNDAGIGGVIVNNEAMSATSVGDNGPVGAQVDWNGIMTKTYELAEECLQTNYYGAKRMIEELTPLLQLSESLRIINISSSMGKLKSMTNEWAKGVLGDAENLTEERVDEVLNEFLRDYKERLLITKCWPTFLSAYTVSEAAMNAYTRIAAKKQPAVCINCVSKQI